MHAYPPEFAERVVAAWDRLPTSERGPLPKPSIDVVRQLLDVVYHATLLTEEAARPPFRVIYCSPIYQFWLDERDDYTVLAFSKPIPFTAPNAARLAPATAPRRVMLAVNSVAPSDRSARGHRLYIWGLIAVNSSWWDAVRGDFEGATTPPDFLTISAESPGHLTVTKGVVALLSLRNGQIIEAGGFTMDGRAFGGFFERVVRDLCEEVSILLEREQIAPDAQLAASCEEVYLGLLKRVLLNVRERRHGGTIILLQDRRARHRKGIGRFGKILNVKYACDSDVAWRVLIKNLVLDRKIGDASGAFAIDSDVPKTVDRLEKMAALESWREPNARTFLETASLIADLCNVDGAVIATDRLRLFGFGAEVLPDLASPRRVRLIQGTPAEKGVSVPVENYGTRHRSAFRYCWRYKEALAFVMSQDGGVKAVRRIDSHIDIWADIELADSNHPAASERGILWDKFDD